MINNLFNIKFIGKLSLIFGLLFLGKQNVNAQAYGDFPYQQSFTSGTQPAEVSIPTGSGTNDATFTTNGIRLTRAVNSLFGAIFVNNRQFSSKNGIKIAFEFGMYGGNGADGISMFLFDAAVTSPVIGAPGGDLGYNFARANNSFSAARKAGLTGAYLGVGFDAFGNFKTQQFQTDKRWNGVDVPGGSHITLRGAAGLVLNNTGQSQGFTGYPVLITQSTLAVPTGNGGAILNATGGGYTFSTGPSSGFDLKTTTYASLSSDPDYRKAFIDIFPNNDILGNNNGFYITVKVQYGNTLKTVIDNYLYRKSFTYTENANASGNNDFNTGNTAGANTTHTLDATVPDFLRIGFAASTGGLNNIQIIKNLLVTLPYAAETADDLVRTCRNLPVIIDPYSNDIAYSGLILISPVPTASNNNIDPNQFRFLNSDGTTAANPFLVSNSQGTFSYSPITKKVTFTPVFDFIGTASINYNIKGITVPVTGGPYGDEAYRSPAANIKVKVSRCQVITNPSLPSKSNYQ
ncbi:hypothetical protein EZ456_21950 [Pedobacter psychrodurus]|uniref:Uncharacterized protein n=1 Tax=Pedobacter psychrodurus TaxID=2530456 RepID=A0A4R0PHI0_9SPHI|nr:hypothetical protein [Pedobacter psychrodurus]TCD18107.1 hypothetical protein EZ456_21950 [Pedobacter psychrodurus]